MSKTVNNAQLRQKTQYIRRVMQALHHMDGMDLDDEYQISAFITILAEVEELREVAEVRYAELQERKARAEEA